MGTDLCKPLFCDFLEGIYCRRSIKAEGLFECSVPEWTLCVTGCEFLHVQAVECGRKEIFVPGTIVVQYVWFDGAHCRHGFCRIPANFCFRNPCTGEAEKVLECNCGEPTGRCSAKLVIERDPKTGQRRHAKVAVEAHMSMDLCCLVGVECPPRKPEDC